MNLERHMGNLIGSDWCSEHMPTLSNAYGAVMYRAVPWLKWRYRLWRDPKSFGAPQVSVPLKDADNPDVKQARMVLTNDLVKLCLGCSGNEAKRLLEQGAARGMDTGAWVKMKPWAKYEVEHGEIIHIGNWKGFQLRMHFLDMMKCGYAVND